MIESVYTMLGSYLPFLVIFPIIVGRGLILVAMRRYPKLHAMLQTPGFKFEIDGEAEQPSKDPGSSQQE